MRTHDTLTPTITERDLASAIRTAADAGHATLYRCTITGRLFGGADVAGYYANSRRIAGIRGATSRDALRRAREIIADGILD